MTSKRSTNEKERLNIDVTGVGCQRLINHLVAAREQLTPAEVVKRLGAMQAQDYNSSLWAIGCRSRGSTLKQVQQAVDNGKLVRTWPMRGTLHFVPGEDVGWMLGLMTPRVLAAAERRRAQLELDKSVFSRCRKILSRELSGRKQFTRESVLALLEAGKVSTAKQRGYHILWTLAQEGLICFAGRAGNQPALALLEEWVPRPRRLGRDEALAELAKRYFTSHGPATLQDYVWWSGLKVSDAKQGLQDCSNVLIKERIEKADKWRSAQQMEADIDGVQSCLLPAFDEILLGYRDRTAVLDTKYSKKIVPGSNGVFLPIAMIKGRVMGTWKRSRKKEEELISVATFRKTTKADVTLLKRAAERYGEFLGSKVTVSCTHVDE